MKYILNIPFQEKDQVKALAQANNTRIEWDGIAKKWFWSGNVIPEFLSQYSAQPNSEKLYYYLCQGGNSFEWYTVAYGAYKTRDEVKAKALELARSATDWEDAVITNGLIFVGTTKKINIGKNIHRNWVKSINDCNESQDAELKAAFENLKPLINQ